MRGFKTPHERNRSDNSCVNYIGHLYVLLTPEDFSSKEEEIEIIAIVPFVPFVLQPSDMRFIAPSYGDGEHLERGLLVLRNEESFLLDPLQYGRIEIGEISRNLVHFIMDIPSVYNRLSAWQQARLRMRYYGESLVLWIKNNVFCCTRWFNGGGKGPKSF